MAGRRDGTRRFPRLRTRCRVYLRDRFGLWTAETEDLSQRGCRIVGPRRQTVGALVRLTLESALVPVPLEVTGQIVWASAERPPRAGVSFAGSAPTPGALAPGAWFESLSQARRGEGAGDPPPAAPQSGQRASTARVQPAALAPRLRERASELARAGQLDAAAVLLRRALALAPGDAESEALLARLAPGAGRG